MAGKAHSTISTTYSSRAEAPNLPSLTTYLLSLMSIKRSNLCVSADVHTTYELLSIAEEVGDYICVLKTHADIVDDWSAKTIKGLQEVSQRKHFLLFEDRKLGDIGNTVQSQYTRGSLAIATWAHLTNAHLLPGPSIIPTLASAAEKTLVSLNQSVDTIISTGTPRTSLDSPTRPEVPSHEAIDSSSPAPSANTPISIANSQTASSTSKSTPQPIFEHHRRSSASKALATATTTISQTYEPATSSHSPSLIKSISIGETSSTVDKAFALQSLGPSPHARGLLLLAEMSTEGNLLTTSYTNTCIEAAQRNKDFVVGFICQHSLNKEQDDAFLNFAPGVGLPKEGDEANTVKSDGKGQQWRSPKEVVGRDGIDVVIVGRGIIGATDRAKEAEMYRKASWEAYEARVGR